MHSITHCTTTMCNWGTHLHLAPWQIGTSQTDPVYPKLLGSRKYCSESPTIKYATPELCLIQAQCSWILAFSWPWGSWWQGIFMVTYDSQWKPKKILVVPRNSCQRWPETSLFHLLLCCHRLTGKLHFMFLFVQLNAKCITMNMIQQ